MNREKEEVVEILLGHCRVLAKSRDPHRRIAASEFEIELVARLEQLREKRKQSDKPPLFLDTEVRETGSEVMGVVPIRA